MATLDKVMQMQSQGMSDTDILSQLKKEGVSPKEINDSLNQAKIKTAVTQEDSQNPGMQQSIMQSEFEAPQAAENQEQIEQPAQQYYYPESPQPYPQDYYPPQQNLDTDTITEIAEQIVNDKFSGFEKKTGDLVSFKNDTLDSLKDLDERLKRIENSIEKLQQAIIGKIGEFGQSQEAIHKDLENLHNTTSKLMNPLIDNYKELQKILKGKK